MVRHQCAQCCDSENELSIVTAMVPIVMLQCWDISTVSATTVTMLSLVTVVTLVCTVVLQHYHCRRCCTVVSLHR